MAELPFLVVHGWWVSKVLVAMCGALGLAVISALRRRAERRQIRLEVEARTAALCGLAIGPASVRGRLRGRAATRVDPSAVAHRDRGESVTIEIEGQRVELRGEIDVVRGSQASASWRRGRTFLVRDDDDVVARGTLTPVAGEGGDYRESAGTWVLEAGDAPIELCAVRPAVRPPALHPRRIALYLALYSAIGYCVLWAVGTGLIRSAKKDLDDRQAQASIAPLGALAIASALPHVRNDALDQLEMQVAYNLVHTEETEQLRIDLAGLHRGCAARAAAEIDALRFEDALATARSCGAEDVELRALMLLGRYHEAAQRHARELSVPLAIADGEWPEAAAITEDLLSRQKREPADNPRLEAQIEQRLHCLALWFRVKAGDPAAANELAGLSPSTSVTCATVHALNLPGEQRAEALGAAANLDRDGQLEESIVAEALAWSYGHQGAGVFATDLFSAIEDLTGRTGSDRFLWLSPWAFPQRHDDPIARARYAVLQAVKGDFTGARRDIDAAIATAGDLSSELQPLQQAIELRTPATIAPQTGPYPHPAVAPLVALRAGTVQSDLDVITMRCNAGMRDALAAAAQGDGGPLADQLSTCDMLFEANARFILAVAPRVTRHREQLASQLRVFHDSYPMPEQLPFSILLDASLRRDLARLAGDEPTATRWQRIVDAHARLLGDRNKIEALLLWYQI